MKKLLLLILLTAVSGGLWMSFTNKPEIKVLVFSKTAQFRHASIAAGQAAIFQLGETHDFEVDTTENAAIFQEKTLQKYDVVIFLNTTGDILNEAQQIAFTRFIQAGGGYVGVHAAADTEYEWPWYGQLVGAYFTSHPNSPNVRKAIIRKMRQAHVSTDHLPDDWQRSDEWYNYRDFNPDIKVLLNLDETTYKGGTNGDNHPITWYHEFDGGRSFYTGLGHTDETYAEPEFLKMLWGGISYAAGDGEPVDFTQETVMPEENRFQKIVLDQGLHEPMELVMLPDRSILFVERQGNIKHYDPQAGKTKIVTKFPVHTGHEDGLLGVALDPKFEENNWLYLFYSPKGETPEQHVSRFVFKDNELEMDSEKILLKIPTQREQCCHSAGSLEFGPEGHLFISVGDNTNPHASNGFNPIDERPGRGPWDAQKSSANMNDLRGKVLRIQPEADGTYTIPDGNLFAKDGSEGRPEIYVMGCRNPFRISVDSHTGYLYWGDVGPDAGEDKSGRGPRGHDEVNQARKPGFFGWPYFVGDNKAYHEFDFAQEQSLTAFDPQNPINNSPNNTGAQALPPAQKAFIWYPYAASKEFPLVGDGGRNAMAGPVYYADDYPKSPVRFPAYYNKKLLTYDWMRGWIMAITLDENANFKRMERFLPSMKFNNPVDMIFSPEGELFLLEYGTNWFSKNKDARLVHLKYSAGNRKPVAHIVADKTIGKAPLTVQFDGTTSTDYDGDELTYAWAFEGEKIQSQEQQPKFTFESPGTYQVQLTVTDPDGEVSSQELGVSVGNDMPKVSLEFSGNRSFYWGGESIDYEVKVSDEEDGTLGNGIDPEAVSLSIDYLAEGKDINLIALGHQARVDASSVLMGKNLIETSDCIACHQKEMASVGPTYLDISNKYKDDENAGAYLTEKVIKGGGGVWGETAMAAHPQLSEETAGQMVKYILSLSQEAPPTNTLPLKGKYTMDQHQTEETDGSYIFTASYTDQGGEKVGPLTAKEMYVLRHPKVQAESYDGMAEAMKFEVKKGMVPGVNEAFEIVIGNKGGHIVFKNLDMQGIQSVEIAASAFQAYMGGGTIEFRLDGVDGKKIGELVVEPSMQFTPAPSKLSLTPTTGFHDLYLHFTRDDEDGKPVCTVDWLEFSTEPID